MTQTIQIKRNNSNATTKPSSLLVGELAGNLLDRSLFSSDGSNVFQFYTSTTKWFDTSGNANNANKLGGVEASSYATQSWVGDNYLSKKGGSLSGGLTVSQGNLIVSVGHTVTGWLYPKDDNASSLGQSTRRWSDVQTVLINGGTPIHSSNYSSYALPLTGGTIKGDLYLDYSLEKYSRIYFIDRRIGSGGYADEILIIRNGAGVNQGVIGLYGNANGVSYYYFGHNAYNGNNLRIYSDKVSFGDNTLYHTGNFNPANYLPLSGGTITSESVPLRLNRTNNVYTTIEYQKDGAVLGYLGFAQDGNGIISPNRATQSNYYYLIHTGNYADTTDKRYLQLSGGTLNSDSYAPLIIDTTNSQSRVQFKVGGVDKALVGWNPTYGAWLYNYPSGSYLHIKDDGTPCYNGNTLYHTGNFNPANYLPLSGGTVTGSSAIPLIVNTTHSQEVGIRLAIGEVSKGFLGYNASENYGIYLYNTTTGYRFGIRDNGDLYYYSDRTNYLIHSGNIGSYNAGSANYLSKSYANEDVNYAKGSGVKMIYSQVSGTNAPIYTSGLSVSTDYSGWQLVAYANPTEKPNPFFRTIDSSNSYPTGWKQLAFLTDNVASATKLQTARTIWGQSFDGTGNVSGNLHLNQSKIYWHSDANNYYIGSYYDGTTNPILDVKYYGGIRFFTSAAERMRIATNGNILVGTTTDSGYKLYVSGTGYFGEKLSVNGGVSITAGNLDLGKNEISNAKAIHCYDSGIGYYVGGRNYGLGATDGGTLIYSYGVTPISFYTNTSERMKITGGGNVLIGTATDSGYKVDINGSTRISGIQLVLGNDNGGQILFQRPSANYIWAYKAGGYLAFGCLDQGTVSLATSSLVVSKGAVYAGATTSLGTSTYKWSKIYGVDIYAEGGWLRTSADNTGLYNSTGDARWYYSVSAGSWVSDKALKIGGNIVLTDRTGSSTTSNRLIFTRSTHDDDYWDFGLYAQSTKGLTFFQSSKGVNTDIGYLDGYGNFVANGDGVFGSDARYKSKLQDLTVDIETIADAPVFSYKWTDREDDKVHLGTTAQYWLPTKFCDAVDTSNPNFYHLNYGALGVAIGVTVAKEQIKVKSEVERLRDRVKELENQVKQLRQWHN